MYRKLSALALVLCISVAAVAIAGQRFSRTEGASGEWTVEDAATGLTWQGCPAGLSGSACTAGGVATYQWGGPVEAGKAGHYCDTLSWGGKDDWCLPDIKELRTIVDNRATSGVKIDTDTFPGTPSSYFWSSSSYAPNSDSAWNVDFNDSYVNFGDKDSSYHVRCVRRVP